MRTTTIFAETHTSERANHVAYRLVYFIVNHKCFEAVDYMEGDGHPACKIPTRKFQTLHFRGYASSGITSGKLQI